MKSWKFRAGGKNKAEKGEGGCRIGSNFNQVVLHLKKKNSECRNRKMTCPMSQKISARMNPITEIPSFLRQENTPNDSR